MDDYKFNYNSNWWVLLSESLFPAFLGRLRGCSVCVFARCRYGLLHLPLVLFLVRAEGWLVGGVAVSGGWSVEICCFQVDLSAYTLVFGARKSFLLAALFRKLLALGFCYRVDGQSIRRFQTLYYYWQKLFSLLF
ncbi:hypothetical protein P8452_67180 [Trifolium repens]|nr:hypothetical protein P8452_67180 [Trifolium repens]